jgi:SAM-dependent methyltransferase
MTTSYEISPCPVCGRADTGELAGMDDLRAEMEEVWDFHLTRLRTGTPTRFLTDRAVFSQGPPLRLARCRGCGTVYRNPRESPRELVETYAGEEVDASVLQNLFEAQRATYRAQAGRLTEVAGEAGAGLEVGSYVGGFLAAARECGWDFEGLDVNEGANAFTREMGFRVTLGSLDDLEPKRTYDAVAIWNCFDQLPEPRAAAQAARGLLSPGGILAIRVPNGGFYAALRPLLSGPASGAARAVLAHNNLLGFPYRHGFTPESLSLLLENAGFEAVRTVGDTLVSVADEWTRPWAAVEEQAVKTALRAVASLAPAPWFELYARAVAPGGS